MYCDQCGTKNREQAKFCFKCGIKFPNIQEHTSSILNTNEVKTSQSNPVFKEVTSNIKQEQTENQLNNISHNPTSPICPITDINPSIFASDNKLNYYLGFTIRGVLLFVAIIILSILKHLGGFQNYPIAMLLNMLAIATIIGSFSNLKHSHKQKNIISKILEDMAYVKSSNKLSAFKISTNYINIEIYEQLTGIELLDVPTDKSTFVNFSNNMPKIDEICQYLNNNAPQITDKGYHFEAATPIHEETAINNGILLNIENPNYLRLVVVENR